MRVLQLHTRHREQGGEDVVVDTEAALLREAGHDVMQFIARNPESAPQAAAALSLAPWNPLMANRLRRVITDFEPDVAHVHNTWFAMSPSVIAVLKKSGVPVVMTLHNYRHVCANARLFRDGRPCEDCVGTSPWQGVRHACYRGSRAQSAIAVSAQSLHRRLGTWDLVEAFIVLTDFQKDVMVRGGVPSDRIKIKPNPVLDPGPRPAPPSESNAVLYVGRLETPKGIDLLIEVWNKVQPRDLELMVVGDGPLRALVEKATAHANVRLTGEIPHHDVRQAMLTSRVLVSPSRSYETFGLVAVEALSAGLPALVSDLGMARWENLSIQQRMLATRVIHKHLFAESIEVWLLENGPLRKNGTAQPALGTNYLAITNSLRLDLQALGLERKARAINPVEAIKAKIEAARQGGSS